ncbi:fatty acid desaturase [Hyphococcus sp.]|uniref:fatty acid desaturase n=1 Tax=Hyphococcus sp. TaxID=2038636 RepID=UPI003CCBBE16
MTGAISPTGRPYEWLTEDERRAVETPSWTKGVRLALIHFALYFLTLYGALGPFPAVVNLLAGFANGFALGLLFIIGHDCVHKCFLPTLRANQILGRLAFLPTAHSASLWETGHNRFHHGKTNFKGVDYVWTPMSVEEYQDAGLLRRLLERLNRGVAGQFLNYPISIWIPKLILPIARETRTQWKRYFWDSVFVVLGHGAIIAGMLILGKWWHPERSLLEIFAVAWLLPMIVWNFLASFSFFLHHAHEDGHWFDKTEDWSFYQSSIEGTTHLEIPALKWLGLYYNVMEHTAHHALTTIPIYHLDKAGKLLRARYGDAVTSYEFRLGDFFRIMKNCKLYDYKNRCWTDFEGRPTGPALEHRRAPAPLAAQ